METEDLLEKAKSGDNRALITWSRPHKPMLSRLAFQAGLSIEEIGKFNRTIIKKFSINLETYEGSNAEMKLLETAVRILEAGNFGGSPAQGGGNLKYAEDLETHQALQSLPMPEKLAVILSWFHDKSAAEIDELLKQPEANAIEEALIKIRNHLSVESESDVLKRLEFLGKSYNRISFPEEDDYLIEEMLPQDEPSAKTHQFEKPPVKRRTIAILAGAGLFLSAVIGTSFLFNEQPSTPQQSAAEEENPTTVTKAMVKKWEAEYDAIRESAPERLGLSQETFEQLEYVRKADELKKRTFSRQNVKQLKDDPERMLNQVEVLMLNIETPKGMLDSVTDYKLLSSETSKFLLIYTEKTDQLMTIADGLLKTYKEELSVAEVNGELSAEKLSNSRAGYPKEIENLTASLSEYTFQYAVHPNEKRFRTVRDVNKFYEIHPFNSDMLSSFYLDILRNTPHFDETGMLWPVEQTPYSIIMMATFMSDPLADPALKGKVESQFLTSFYTLLKGDEHTDIFNSNGVVKEEFQIAWESLLHHDSNPVTFMMLPILEEFEASNWTESAHYDQLAYPDILYATDLESKGELKEKLPNGNMQIETVNFDVEGYDYSDVQPLYKKFSAAHDIDVLAGVEPMEIIKLYHYANKIEDIKTMWHLTADDVLKPSLEEYTEKWRKRPEITETMRNIEIYAENLHRQGRKVYLMAFGQNIEFTEDYRMMTNNMSLVTEKDQIWLMQNQIDEYYTKDQNFEAYDANVQNYYKSIAASGDLNSVQLAKPAEIAGVFLLALENEDVQTMRLLVHEMDDSISDEEFKERWLNGHLTVYSKMTGIAFTADYLNLEFNGVRGNVDIIMNSETMEDSRYLPMEKVDEFWMIGDMFGY